jgi:hypothetical protein
MVGDLDSTSPTDQEAPEITKGQIVRLEPAQKQHDLVLAILHGWRDELRLQVCCAAGV